MISSRENWNALKCMIFIKKIPVSFCITPEPSSRLSTDALWDPKVCLPSWWPLILLPAFTWVLSVFSTLICLALHVDIIPLDIILTSAPHIWQSLPHARSNSPDLPLLQQHLVMSPQMSENFYPHIHLARWIPWGACYGFDCVPSQTHMLKSSSLVT